MLETEVAEAGHLPRYPVKLPVLYVPGFLSPFTYAWYFERGLRRQGYEFDQVAFPRLALGDMAEMARTLATHVEAVAGEFGLVNLVCHSAGGLIARYYLQKLNRLAPVSSIVFLGTPHEGTLAAYPGFLVRTCRQMTPESKFMYSLGDSGLGRILTDRSLSLYSTHDLLVIPFESGRLAGGRNVRMKGPFGHALPLDPRALGLTLTFIDEMAPV
jgi:triacylglycerol lipase